MISWRKYTYTPLQNLSLFKMWKGNLHKDIPLLPITKSFIKTRYHLPRMEDHFAVTLITGMILGKFHQSPANPLALPMGGNKHLLHLLLENISVSENRQTGENNPTVFFVDEKKLIVCRRHSCCEEIRHIF